jgi:hypothetical protein
MDVDGTWSEEQVSIALTNPLFALGKVHSSCVEYVRPIISEEKFIEEGVNFIQKEGAEKYIRLLLQNLKDPCHIVRK